MNESWRDIPGWEGLYEASDMGRIRSNDRVTGGPYGSTRKVKGKVLVHSLVKGYPQINLKDKERKECHYVHRLVLLTFLGDSKANQQGCHNDGNRTNNTLPNLRWGTLSENKADMVRHRTSTWGERNPMAKMNDAAVSRLRKERKETGLPYAALGRKYGISEANAHAICTGVLWKSVGQEEAA